MQKKTVKHDIKAEKAGRQVTKDIEYDERAHDKIHGKKRGSEDKRAEKAGRQVTKDIEYDDKRMVKESKHYHLGKADAFEGRVGCMAERGSDEHKDYFRGFRDGLNEAYGCDEGIYEDNMSQGGAADPNTASVMVQAPVSSTPMPPPKPASQAAPGSTTPGSTTNMSATVPTALEETMFLEDDEEADLDQLIQSAIDDELAGSVDADEDELDEGGNKFLGARADALAQGHDKFTVDGETFPVREDEYDFMEIMETAIRKDQLMNSWNTKLSALLAEQTVTAASQQLAEGMTVTTTSGSEHMPDSVNINATDEDAHELMRILKHSGLKLGLGDSSSDDHHDANNDDDDAIKMIGYDANDDDEDYASEEEESCGDDDGMASPMSHHNTMMSTQDQPKVSVMRLQPRDAVDFDDVIGAFGGRMSLGEQQELLQLLKLSGKDIMEAGEHPKGLGMSTKPTENSDEPAVKSPKEVMKDVKRGKPAGADHTAAKTKQTVSEGMMDMPAGKGMSKNVKDSAPKAPKPTDQSAIMSTLKPGTKVKNSGLESLHKSHDPGPASSDKKGSTGGDSPNKPKTPKPSEKHDFENASLSENIAHDLYKLYTISENAAANNIVTGYKQVDAMAMPRGMGMSVQADDTPQKVVEPTDHEDVMKALDAGEPKIVKFPKLERLLKDHMPDTEEPEIMDKQSEAETAKLHAAPHETASEKDSGAYADSESEKKLDEGKDEMCSECGSYMEEGHQCEDDDTDDREVLDEWANDQGRDGTDKAETMSTDYMVNLKSGGLNGIKRDQTTLPHTEVKIRAGDDLGEWLKLSGLR